MLSGIEDIRNVETALIGQEISHGVLLEAGTHFWHALYGEQSWPPALRDRAWRIIRFLLRDGVMSTTVPNLTDGEMRQLRDELLAFVHEAAQASKSPR